jgi:hypothetical protein
LNASDNCLGSVGISLKSKVDTDKIPIDDLEFNLSLSIGNDSDASWTINGIKLKTYWLQTHINVAYYYRNEEIEVNFSNTYINEHFFDGMKLEFQTNPSLGALAVLITMSL